MKKILLPIIVCLPLISFGQTQSSEIDLKLEQVAKERHKEEARAERNIIIGGVLSAVGLGVGLVGPELIKEPTDPTPRYLNEVRLAGTNTQAAASITNKYKTEYAAYNEKIADNKKLEKNLHIGGGCLFAIGVGFGVDGIIKLARIKD